MAFTVSFEGILLDHKEGTFVTENEREVSYHNARFYDQEDSAIYKVKVPDGTVLPEPAVAKTIYLKIDLTERYCSASYIDCEG